jgi:hypothetical protein
MGWWIDLVEDRQALTGINMHRLFWLLSIRKTIRVNSKNQQTILLTN